MLGLTEDDQSVSNYFYLNILAYSTHMVKVNGNKF